MRKVIVFSRKHVRVANPAAVKLIQERFTCVRDPRQAEALLVMGGDGTMLDAIRKYQGFGLPFVGLNYGHVGFLMNTASVEVIEEIADDFTQSVTTQLLKADLYDQAGNRLPPVLAFNDFYMERTRIAAAYVRISVEGTVLFDPLIADGVIVSTAAGSTAYNAAAGGMIVPLDASAICLTGISPAIFHSWRTSVLSISCQVTLEALSTEQRPVRLLADGKLIKGVQKAIVSAADCYVQLLFARSYDYRQKVLNAQFGIR